MDIVCSKCLVDSAVLLLKCDENDLCASMSDVASGINRMIQHRMQPACVSYLVYSDF